jgi:hypothetical protein
MNKHYVISFVLITLLVFSRCNEHSNNQDENISTAKKDTAENNNATSIKKTDTIFKSYYYEDTLKNGYRFGMTVSGWNKQLAILAKSGFLSELAQMEFARYNDEVVGSYKGFYSEDKSGGDDNRKNGFYITGLFANPHSTDDTVEVFKLNNKIVNQPILIGIKLDFNIPYGRYADMISILLGRDNLMYKAGPDPILPNENPLSIEEFSDPVADYMSKSAGASQKSPGEEKQISKENTTKTLFEGKRFYSIIEVKEIDRATVTRNSEYKITSLKDGFRYYSLAETVYSKKQYDLKISDYMTDYQKQKIDKSSETKKLIDRALK